MPSALDYAGYIGRIGVPAAALGVGAAVASTPGTAWAEPADADSATSPSSSPSVSAPATRPARPQVNHGSGAVSGVLHVPNPNHDDLTYTVGWSADGTVTLSPDGTFTYTPTAQARRDAATEDAGLVDQQDFFTVTVSDAHGGSSTVPVWVAIDPVTVPPARTLTLSGVDGNPVNASVTVTDPDTDPVVYLAVHDTASAPTPMAGSR